MKVNSSEYKTFVYERDGPSQCDKYFNEEELEVVNDFTYLGAMVSKDGGGKAGGAREEQ